MRITITGASGLIGSRARRPRSSSAATRSPRSRCARDDRPAPSSQAATRSSTSRARTSPSAGATTPRSAIRESREQGTRRLVEAIDQADPRPKALISASAVGYYGPHGDERLDEDTPPGDDFLAAGLRRLGARGRAGRGARPARRARPHRRRARHGRRRAVEDAAAVQARRAAARSPAATSTCRGSTSTTSSASTSPRSTTRLERPGQRHRARAGHQQGVQQGARAGAAPPGGRPDPGRRDHGCSTATWPRSSPRASAWSRERTLALGYTFQHPDLDERSTASRT